MLHAFPTVDLGDFCLSGIGLAANLRFRSQILKPALEVDDVAFPNVNALADRVIAYLELQGAFNEAYGAAEEARSALEAG